MNDRNGRAFSLSDIYAKKKEEKIINNNNYRDNKNLSSRLDGGLLSSS